MGMMDNNEPKKEMPYGLARRQAVNTPGRGLGRFAERNEVTGVESGFNTAFRNVTDRLGRPIRTAEDVQREIDQKVAAYEKSKKKK